MADEHASEGFEHLQTAALELIAAARAFLDVAEAMVREPGVASTIVSTAASVGRTFLHGTAAPSSEEDPAPQGAVRRVNVS